MDEAAATSLWEMAKTNVPARAVFVARFLGSTMLASLSLGLVGGQIGSVTAAGPLVPFLVCSWAGYTLACWRFWILEVQQMRLYATKYPKLLERALRTEFALWATIDHPFADWIHRAGVGRLSWAILATQSCLPYIADLEQSHLQDIIGEYKSNGPR